MNKIRCLVWVLLFLCAGAAFAYEQPSKKPYVGAQRSLAINRSLLSKSETEYERLSKEGVQELSNQTAEALTKLRYKIMALREDAERLQSELPKNVRAAEFLKDLLGYAPVDINREKKLNEKLQSLSALHEKALTLVSQKEYQAASKIYEEILLESPEDDEAYLLLGHTCLLATEYEKAKRAFSSAIQIDPVNQAEIGRFYKNILLENPQDDAAYAHLGFVYWMLGQKDEAKKAFESALAINPENLEAKTALEGGRSAQ